MRRTTLSRADLHALVWSKPLRTAAKELGISDVGLSKICKRHGVPTPPQGHWTSVQFGKSVSQGELPPAQDGQSDEIVIVGDEAPSQTGSRDRPCPPGEEPRRDELLVRETKAEFLISPRQRPAAWHPLAAQVKKALEAKNPDDYGCVHCKDAALPRVRVAPESIARAVSLLDAIARAAEARGIKWKRGRGDRWDDGAALMIEDIAFPIEIYETVERRPHELTPEERARKARGRVRKIQEEEAKRRAVRLAEIKRLRALEQESLEELHDYVANWRRAEDLRSLIAAVAAAPAESERQHKWLSWAGAYADAIDPLRGDLDRLIGVDFASFAKLRAMQAGEDFDEDEYSIGQRTLANAVGNESC